MPKGIYDRSKAKPRGPRKPQTVEKKKCGRKRDGHNLNKSRPHNFKVDWTHPTVKYMVGVMNAEIDAAKAEGRSPAIPLHGEALTPLAQRVWAEQLKLRRRVEKEMRIDRNGAPALADFQSPCHAAAIQQEPVLPASLVADVKAELPEPTRDHADVILDAVSGALCAMKRCGLDRSQINRAARIVALLTEDGAA